MGEVHDDSSLVSLLCPWDRAQQAPNAAILAGNTSFYDNSSCQDNSIYLCLLKDTLCRDMIVCEGRVEMQQDALDRIVEEWRLVHPNLDPSPLAVLGRLQRLAGLVRRRVDAILKPYALAWELLDVLGTLRRAAP